ncbi:hypothetical protein [Streptomyces sp. NPDC048277]|uniref:hypothetical protein n=1 Tax=Streptomyces sp. NPDC048277 TaxID=3155027 RepID=UPI0033D1AD93
MTAAKGYDRPELSVPRAMLTATSINDIARDLTIWMAARDFPGRPAKQITDFSNTA